MKSPGWAPDSPATAQSEPRHSWTCVAPVSCTGLGVDGEEAIHLDLSWAEQAGERASLGH